MYNSTMDLSNWLKNFACIYVKAKHENAIGIFNCYFTSKKKVTRKSNFSVHFIYGKNGSTIILKI